MNHVTKNKLLTETARRVISTGAVLALGVATVVVGGANVLAWGPDRPTYTSGAPADHVVFNSITDNPAYGDERNFVRIKPADAGNSAYADDVDVEPGKEYEVMVYFHNNASKTFNSAEHDFKGIAKDTRLRVAMPDKLTAGERTGLTGYISASNATPKQVYDDAFMKSSQDVALKYVSGSAKVTSFGAVNGQTLPDSFLLEGANLGYDSLNGELPGCNEYAGYVTYKFTAEAPNFTLKKQVRKVGDSEWKDRIVANLGDRIEYNIAYQNTGTVRQENVVIRDAMPKTMEFVGGSTIMINSHVPGGEAQPDGIVTNGLNIGSYASMGNAGLKYEAIISGDLEKCGLNELVNYATAITAHGNKQVQAVVEVNVDCAVDECKPGIPVGDERCEDKCIPVEGQIVDSDGNCVAAPSTLPTTGPTEVVLSLIGLAALIVGAMYWYKSRKDLQKLLATGDVGELDASSEAPKLLQLKKDTDSEKSEDK